MRTHVKLNSLGRRHMNGNPPNDTLIVGRQQCNCCRLGEECMSPRVTTRTFGDIPGCIKPIEGKTFLETENIDVKVTDYAQELMECTDMYKDGRMDYDVWMRHTWNYGKIKPVR